MKRYENNPVVSRQDIPDVNPYFSNVTSVFNSGAIKIDDRYLLMLRVQSRGRETMFLMAESCDGLSFEVSDEPVHFTGIESVVDPILHNYDPRITKIDETYYIMFAMEFEPGCQLGVARTHDFKSFEFLGLASKENTRNGVLFPETFDGYYLRMDRPNRVQLEGGPNTGKAIYLSRSKDMIHWEPVKKLISGRYLHWDELIGSGPPPVKTRKGWLHLYHGIAMHYEPIYQVGVMMLDLNDPSKVIARGRNAVLEPRELYELVGQVPNVIFPCGMIVEETDDEGFAKMDSEVKLYYGAADTSLCLATTTVEELVNEAFLQ